MSPLNSRCVLMLLACVVASTGFAQDGWTPERLVTSFPRVGGVAVSPDGKLVTYTVGTALIEGEKSEFLTHVWVATADGRSNRQFTFGEKSCTSPIFSPDGEHLAFTSSRSSDGKNQVWILSLDGGEARQVTKAKAGVGSYAWSPDGGRIAYLAADPETEAEEKEKKEKRDIRVVDQNLKFNHLYVVDIGKAIGGDFTSKRLTAGDFHITSFSWSPDGKTLAFAHQPSPAVDVWTSTDLSTVPSDSGEARPLVTRPGSDANPRYSPDGSMVAFTSQAGKTGWAGGTFIFVVPVGGGTPRQLAASPGESPGLIAWSADGRNLLFAESERTLPRLWWLPVDGGSALHFSSGDGSVSGAAASADGKTVAYVFQSTSTPPEIYVSPSSRFGGKKISTVNDHAPRWTMGKTELISWTSFDGKTIEGLLTYPVEYSAGEKVPLILNIHGGPAGVFTQSFTGAGSVYPLQAFAQEGYAILRPNPRGSGGYGTAFRTANLADWGFGDYEDMMSGVDKVVAMGVAHPDSLVVCGWSYGGYMTSFAITRTDRFKAAAVGAGVTNLVSMTGTSDIPSFLPYYFGGELWDRYETYEKHSAMYRVGNVKTPTLILHGERDNRVPMSQGMELYIALRRLGVPTEMAVYPRTPHGPQEPKFIVDCGMRMIAWFNKHLRSLDNH